MSAQKGFGRCFAKFASVTLAVVVMWSVCFPGSALAYFSKPAVGVSLGAGSVSLATGQSTTVGVSVGMWSEDQLPGCGMSACPQACGGLVNPSTGEMGGCLNEAGWCTCSGMTYYTAYTQITVSSSNPSVARASASGGALYIDAYSAGSATITVTASLSKHVDSYTSMTVYVSDPTPSPSPTPSDNGGSSSGSASSGGSSADSGSGASAGGAVSVTAVGGTSATAAAAAAAEASGSSEQVVEMEAEDGSKTIVVEAKDAATAAEELGKIVGTKGTVTFWSGGTLGSPAISWTFKGENIAEGADLNIDPTVSVSKHGTGDVSKLLADVDKSIVMDFAHSGALPASAEVFVRASDVFADGDELNLFTYNEDSKKFERVQDGVKVADGYATFSIDHCSVWALSKDDLTKLEMPADGVSDSDKAAIDATQVNMHAESGTPYVIAVAVVVAIAVVAVIAVVVVRRKKAAVALEASADDAVVCGDAIDGANDGADALDDSAEGEK